MCFWRKKNKDTRTLGDLTELSYDLRKTKDYDEAGDLSELDYDLRDRGKDKVK